jgi:hypothetical protein
LLTTRRCWPPLDLARRNGSATFPTPAKSCCPAGRGSVVTQHLGAAWCYSMACPGRTVRGMINSFNSIWVGRSFGPSLLHLLLPNLGLQPRQ